MEGATRAAALTRRLLAFARAEPLLPEAIAPAALVQGMLELIDRTIGERIRVHTATPGEPWPVWADPTGLENAVLNLCVNARDAMPTAGDLTSRSTMSPWPQRRSERWRRAICSHHRHRHGRGIAPEHIERVFGPSSPPSPSARARGLGLSRSSDSRASQGAT
jgi:signal transduction histidine kinase